MEKLEKRVDEIEKKLDKLIDLIENKVEPNTNKMSNHIDFIETVYDNIKNPLGYFIHKLSYFKDNDENHSIEENKFD